MYHFSDIIKIIGINPYISVPDEILHQLFTKAGRDKGSIPVCGEIEGKEYTQTLVKYQGAWRLYINTIMLKDSPKLIGKTLSITIDYDPRPRTIIMHPKFQIALDDNPRAKEIFQNLPPWTRKEIIKYIAALKTDASIERNIKKAIGFLLGENGFIGRKNIQ